MEVENGWLVYWWLAHLLGLASASSLISPPGFYAVLIVPPLFTILYLGCPHEEICFFMFI